MTLLGELLSVAGIYLSSQLIINNDPLARLLSGVFIGLLLISFGIMIAFYRLSGSSEA
jgi:hypothetical protein